MRFVWDEEKNRRNRAKHSVSFDAAKLVFDDPRAISQIDETQQDEERWITIGLAARVVVLLVVHTVREEGGEETIRIISARKATPRERKVYENGI
jgi:uncharacterized DUF497 family protein